MKTLKKSMAILIIVVLLLAMAVPVMADNTVTGTITINNADIGTVYSAYKLLDLSYESHGTSSTADDGYVYYLPESTSPWYAFLTGDTVKDVYLTIGANDIVTWKEGADAEVFAELALAYVASDNITADSAKQATETTVTLDAAGPGYYLVDSSMGALVVLTSALPDVTIAEKNDAPTIEKKVLEIAEDGTETWEDLNRVEAGETISYKITINAKNGAQNYVLHDVMDDDHVDYTEGSVVIYLNDNGTKADTNIVSNTNYTLTEGNLNDGCTFEIKFSDAYLESLDSDDVLTVYYEALFVGTAEAVQKAPHSNTAWLTYGDNGKTVEDTVQTVSYGMEVLKYANGNVSLPLGGAKFELYRDEGHNDRVYVHFVEKNTDGLNIYTVCNRETHNSNVERITVMETPDETGTFILYGLDLETYYLVETEAPAGYNPLEGHVEVTLDINHITADRIFDVNVNNNTGSMLPSTGGIGTTIFYIAGGLLVVAAIVLLITRKRMSAES